MADRDPIPPANPAFRGLGFALITLLVGLAAWGVIGLVVWGLAWLI